jgi:hypothetical protein
VDDILPAAEMLLGKFGERAALLAAMRARDLLDQGAQEGGLFWIKIARAIEAMHPQSAGE